MKGKSGFQILEKNRKKLPIGHLKFKIAQTVHISSYFKSTSLSQIPVGTKRYAAAK